MVKKQDKVLLSSHVKPTHYKIYLEPDLESFIFQGEETIEFETSKNISELTLHSAELEIVEATILGKNQLVASKIEYDNKKETVTFKFTSSIKKGKSKIRLKFSGILNDKMRGFYRSRYVHNGREYYMGVTQFESTDARRAFPCFDEPSLKATFEVSLRVPSDRTVISNTLEEEIVEQEGGYKVVRFEKSPVMSSYLLAFVVGHFEFVETKSKKGVRVRVYVTPGKKRQAMFALDTAAKIMDFYHDYFGIAYPLPTMDLIAIPDFANGAMENWGAVTYRETALLVDPKNSSLHTKQWVALIIAHELAHQWFGNLVTMKWWTHLWLNEGFASFMEYLAVDKLFPEWHVWTQFVYTEQAKALSLDGMSNTHPIEIEVHHPGEISEIFDAVSYSKGASIIRMIESFIGEKNFQKGLQLYLKKHKYSNANTADLWGALESVSKKPVGKIMKNWTSKGGYPLVEVDKKGQDIILSQSRFYSSKEKLDKEGGLWSIPLSIITDKNKKPHTFLLDKKRVVLKNLSDIKWIKLNSDDTSFVRVKYSSSLLDGLLAPIKEQDSSFSEEGRFAIVRDAFSLAESGQLKLGEALKLVASYTDDKSYIVWSEICSRLLEIKSLFSGSVIEKKYDEYSRDILRNISNDVGWKKSKDEPHEKTLLRSSVKYAMGSFKDNKTIKESKELFQNGKGDIPSDLKGAVYAIVGENGGKEEFNKFLSIYLENEMEEEKDRALRAICSFQNIGLLKKVLKIAFSSKVRSQDAFKAVYIMSTNPTGIDIAWDFVTDNWAFIEEKFAGGHLFSRFISPFAKFKTEAKRNEVRDFFKKNKAYGIERTVLQTIEKINSNVKLIKRESKDLEKFLTIEINHN